MVTKMLIDNVLPLSPFAHTFMLMKGWCLLIHNPMQVRVPLLCCCLRVAIATPAIVGSRSGVVFWLHLERRIYWQCS